MAAVTSFYKLEARNRRESVLLVLFTIFILVLLGTLIGTAVVGDVVGALPVIIFAGLLGFGSVAGAYYVGDSAVLSATNAKPADPKRDAKLINVVTELSLADGLPIPKIYVIPDTALNAFATGRDKEHASLAVTQGLIDKLDREELQGVVGHELSHIRNLDIRYALLIAALVGAIVLLADIFLHSVRYWRPKGKNGAAAWLMVLLLAIFFAILAPIFARLVQMAASRQREYLADASSVELTRNPIGMEDALIEVGRDKEVLEVANRATQHLYFTNPIHRFEKRSRGLFSSWGLFSTHPSIVDRVNRIRSLRDAPPLNAATASSFTE